MAISKLQDDNVIYYQPRDEGTLPSDNEFSRSDFVIKEQNKAYMASCIIRLLRKKEMIKGQSENARQLGLAQSDFSLLVNGKVKKFSMEKLLIIVVKLGGTLEISE